MLLAMMFILSYVSNGFMDHVKLLVRIVEKEEYSFFNLFTCFNLLFQIAVGGAVCQISQTHLFVAYTPKSILIDMFALILIADIDEAIATYWVKFEVMSTVEGHKIT